jgi:hypothetical protein
MAVTGGDAAVERDPTAGGHLSMPRTLDKFKVRPNTRTNESRGLLDGVDGGGFGTPGPPKQVATPVYPVRGRKGG